MKEIIAQNKGLIRAVIRRLTGAYNEDLEQEVYIKTWKNLDKYREQGKFRQWIAALTANVCRDYFKSRQYHQSSAEISDEEALDNAAAEAPQEKALDAKTRQKLILKAVDELPPKMRKAIILFEFEELSLEQIAHKTGVPAGTVKSRLFNARQILSQKLSYLKGE